MDHFIITIALIAIVIVVASLLSGALERIGAPIVAVFLGLGAALGPAGLGVVDITLESPILHALAILALVLVLFSDAVTLETSEIRAQRRLAVRLLVPGTLVPAALIALAGWWLLGVSAPAALTLGAALASTDPVLLRSLLRSRALPADTRVALRLETGMNDVVLLPIVVLSMLALREDGVVGAAEIGESIVSLFLLGPGLGALVGWLGIRMLVGVRDRVGVRRDYESLYALGLAFGAYAAAEAVGGSGFLAAFAAGLMVAVQDVELCDCFLEYGEATAEMLLLLTFVAFGTSLIWRGLLIVDGRTLLFAAIAIVTRTAVLYPMLRGSGVDERNRRLIAFFGARGLSSLLLVLLPVFAGLPGAEQLFTVTCLVVLLSVLVHGSGTAMFVRANRERPLLAGAVTRQAVTEPGAAPAKTTFEVPERITIAELRELWARNEPVTILDARAEKGYRADTVQAQGAIRLPPDEAKRSAAELGLTHHGTLVIYCA